MLLKRLAERPSGGAPRSTRSLQSPLVQALPSLGCPWYLSFSVATRLGETSGAGSSPRRLACRPGIVHRRLPEASNWGISGEVTVSTSSDVSGVYVHKPGGPSWHEWLILREQRQIVLEAAERQKEDITRSIEDSADKAADKAADTIRQAIETASEKNVEAERRSTEEILLSIGEFHADFNWHLENVELALDHMNAILSHVRDELSRRHRSEAFEFYYQSLEYAQHGMFEKALNSIEVAIHGDERGARGYELEWRFWEHLGRLRLGSLKNITIVDLERAENAFLQAAHLATQKAAARCLVGAAFAAYADGRLPDAIDHIRSALSHHPDLAEAQWNLGRYLWQAETYQEAADGFYRALSVDPNYARRFKDDEALQEPAGETRCLHANLVQKFRQRFDRDRLNQIREQARSVSESIVDLGLDASAAKSIEGQLDTLTRLAESDEVLHAAKLGIGGNEVVTQIEHRVEIYQRSAVGLPQSGNCERERADKGAKA